MREKTNVYFISKIYPLFNGGDCILLENIDSNGKVRHALIDTGVFAYNEEIVIFLDKHKVQKLDFFCITHSHLDHNYNAVAILNKYPVDILIMKEFDMFWSEKENPQFQNMYERILTKSIEKNIKILGVSFESLVSDEYSPSLTENFKKNVIKNAKKENFEYFNENNTSFDFGSAYIELMNWEIFDTEGNIFITGQNGKDGKKVYRDTYTGDNQNSLGLLLYQGDKKAFFAGDMNNSKKNVGGQLIGDEDRLKDKIGKVDFLKLGHHEYGGSNSYSYMETLSPDYAVITNDIGGAYYNTINYLESKNINYFYTVNDQYELSATIYNDSITIGFGTSGIKKLKEKIFYVPENKIYTDYSKCNCEVKYEFTEKSVSNWDELKTVIEEYNIEEGFYINEKCYIGKGLLINLKNEGNNIYIANSTINIDNIKNIRLISKNDEIIIKRDISLIESPLFIVKTGILTLGEENMKGKIIIDGNKNNVDSTSQLIQLICGELSIYDNIILCNNIHKISYKPTPFTLFDQGSCILAQSNSKINIYGGEISDNINEIYIDKNMDTSLLPETTDSNYLYDVKGAGIYLNNSSLNMYGGKISNNEGINNTEIYTNKNWANNSSNYRLSQSCFGTAIYAEAKSKINLYKGEISNNISTNNAKTNLITPNEGTIINLSSISDMIYGSALFCNDTDLKIFDDFIIQNNISKLNTTINIEKNCTIKGGINTLIRGGQVYLSSSRIQINGGIIRNSNNIKNFIFNVDDEISRNMLTINQGGGMQLTECKDFDIKNLKIMKCNADYGGGLHFINCNGKFSNLRISDNLAENYGGGFLIDMNSVIELDNVKILNNCVKEENGGGIYNSGELVINGKDSSISNNESAKSGGGIVNTGSGKVTINYCTINNNKALKYSGGGLFNNGELFLNDAKIYENWSNYYGGGIYYYSIDKFIFDKNKINEIVYDNKAGINGDNIYPSIK